MTTQHIAELLPLVPKPTVHEQREDVEEWMERRRRDELWRNFILDRARFAECRASNYAITSDRQAAVVAALREYSEHLAERVAAGNGILLYGPSGTGKDHLLTAIARLAIFQHGLEVGHVSGPEQWASLRAAIDDKNELEVIDRARRPRVLVITDPAICGRPLTDFQRDALYRIVDGRWRAKRVTWTAVNVATRTELEQLLGSPTVDRMLDGALVENCNWPSYRKPT